MVDVKDLEEYWNDLRTHKIEITPEAEGPESVIDRAVIRVQEEVGKFIEASALPADFRDPKHLGPMFTGVFRILLRGLYEEQRKQDVSLLVQLFLEGAESLSPDEIKGFIQALPRPLINGILARMGNQRSGLHALLSVEALWRDRGSEEPGYDLRRDHEGKLVVTFYPKEVGEAVTFRLRELFEGKV
jgi:hypothetical protein